MAEELTRLAKSKPSNLDSGVFTWDISSNQFFADSAFALLFGLDHEETMSGLPMERYLERVHPEDKGMVARNVHRAIVAGTPCQQNYRVQSSAGYYTEIMSFGRCFRNPDGTPSQYAGIVYPVVPILHDAHSLADLCGQTYRSALKSGRLDIARALRGVMDDIGDEPSSAQRQAPN